MHKNWSTVAVLALGSVLGYLGATLRFEPAAVSAQKPEAKSAARLSGPTSSS